MDFSNESNNFAKSPAEDEFEISVFGPGIGECILMHLGNGEWFVIDSCRLPGSNSPAALDYLDAVGIEPASAIKRILATHWHDDHVKGMSEIVRRCPDALFAMSAALESDQFNQLVFEIEEQNKLVAATSTASEFADILEEVELRGKQPPTAVSDGFLLFEGGFEDLVKVRVLSPSPATVRDAQNDIVNRLQTGFAVRKFKRFDPNDLSVAVQVSTGARDLLLKSDLEDTAEPQYGWKAVLTSKLRPRWKSSIVKIGHHGSDNADNGDVWQEMVFPSPKCVVTPYTRLKEPLPRVGDINRIKSRTDHLFCTTWPPSTRPPRRQGVDGLVAGATKTRHALNRKPGFVRLRWSFTDSAPPTIELFGSAKEL